MAALRAGNWRIEQVTLDDAPRLRLTANGYLVGAGYFASVDALALTLSEYGGPPLADFTADDGIAAAG